MHRCAVFAFSTRLCLDAFAALPLDGAIVILWEGLPLLVQGESNFHSTANSVESGC